MRRKLHALLGLKFFFFVADGSNVGGGGRDELRIELIFFK